MIELELGSTGAEEISAFQRLLLVNGTNPLRLAPCPVDITLQSRFPPPVPPPFPPPPLPPFPPPPPELFDELDTPEQAENKKIASTTELPEMYCQADRDPSITPLSGA